MWKHIEVLQFIGIGQFLRRIYINIYMRLWPYMGVLFHANGTRVFVTVLTLTVVFEQFKIDSQKKNWYVIFSHLFPEAA
jgi:hypothetical protein